MANETIAPSIMATLVAEVVTLPICTVKTNFQNGTHHNIMTTFRKIYQTHGIIGFYRSSSTAVLSQVLSTTIKYNGYQYMKTKTNYKMLAGLSAGITASLITHPVDVVKVHLQMNQPFISILKEHGLFLLYRGYSKSLTKVSISSSCFFPIYDTIKDYHQQPAVAAFSSAVISTTLMQPIDYMKIRHIYGLSYFDGLNPLTYFRGLSLNLMRVVPHFMITMSLIEYWSTKLSSKHTS